MHAVPRDRRIDSTVALLADPYGFISKQCRALGTDLFEARILLQPTVCMTGADAARFFYDTRYFQRAGAAPEAVQATLFGKRAVQGLDGSAHLARKALFLKALDRSALQALSDGVRRQWHSMLSAWTLGQPVALYEAAQEVLGRAVFEWAGVPVPEAAAGDRTADLVSLFDDAARGLVPHLQSRLARQRSERWLAGIIDAVRRGRVEAPAGSALHAAAFHQGADGEPLPNRIAATELLNILRPVVAISVFIVFVAHALHRYPECRALLRTGDADYRLCFLNEVRRYYPFFPAVAARVSEDTEWHGMLLRRGTRAMLDLYGTNHDPRSWSEPERFLPARFSRRAANDFDFIPQGGADTRTHHRCPGEDATLALMDVSADVLLNHVDYDVVRTSEALDMRRLPAMPRDGFTLAPKAIRA
ncbi:MAG: cytochrome P450 [Pigmentiphaga sp.]|uniref:cytochrome P450 n=1 Tax=Pigmentiphaga sp. TaxID=1977564 RepID=UPI0029B93B00|nr:cytochrome P450 [Pigmentiphaga sp.]MDX3906647.1 cytochrome P450 [Pigmentiphaga sp.]